MRTGDLNIIGDLKGDDYRRIIDNIAINAFRIAINGSLTQFLMEDGVIDEYEDQSGIDSANSGGYIYGSGGTYYSLNPTGGNTTVDYMEYSDDPSAQNKWRSDCTNHSYSSDYSLHLPFEGDDGDDTTSDYSQHNHTVTMNGTAQIDTDEKILGDSSLLLDGDSDYLTIPASSYFDVDTNFTIDFFIKFTTNGDDNLILHYYKDNDNYWYVYRNSSNKILVRYQTSNVDRCQLDSSSSLTAGNWYHIAVCKVGSDWGLYINGFQEDNDSDSTTTSISTDNLYIGKANTVQGFSVDYYTPCNMDGLRISQTNHLSASPDGTNSDRITPPTGNDDIAFILNCEGDDGDTETYDISGNNREVTFYNSAQIDTAQYKYGSSSLKLTKSTSDYITVGGSRFYQLDTNWSFDCFVKLNTMPSSYPADFRIFDFYQDSSNYFFLQVYRDNTIYLRYTVGGSTHFEENCGAYPSDGNWHHIAVCKVGSDWGVYLDGQQIGYASESSINNYLNSTMTIGSDHGNDDYLDGWMDCIRCGRSNYLSASPVGAENDVISEPGDQLSLASGDTDLVALSENVTTNQGSYSLQLDASDASDKKRVRKTLSNPLDLSSVNNIKFDIYSPRTGSDLYRLIFRNSTNGTDLVHDITISSADTWETNTVDVSVASEAHLSGIDEIIIEVLEAPASSETFYIDNMYAPYPATGLTLISNSTEAEVQPHEGRIIILEEDVDTITINTDIKAFISRDAGNNWEEVTLSDEGDYDGSKRILSANADLTSQNSDKTMRYKIVTYNSKDCHLHATGLFWRA